MSANVMEHKPKPKVFREKIGYKEFELSEERLDVIDDVALWGRNPRLQPYLEGGEFVDETQLEDKLKRTKGYDVLKKSIEDVGQLEPIYVWKRADMSKYLVLEGATRVTILRDLSIKHAGKPDEDRFRRVIVKVLPEEFTEEERVILLACIHVRGTGVRSWGRYVEAKFIHDCVTAQNGHKPITTVRELSRHMGKSDSWVSRLKDAYEFSRRYVEYIDANDAEVELLTKFSVLEEISKATGFGVLVKDYANKESEELRNEVFEMVRNDVFSEYRDARFIKNFYDDPEKWAQLKSHEKHIANKLANEERVQTGSLRVKIEGLASSISRTLERDPEALDENDLENLQRAVREISSRLSNVSQFRLQLVEFSRALQSVGLEEIKSVTSDEYEALKEGLDDFELRFKKHNKQKQWA